MLYLIIYYFLITTICLFTGMLIYSFIPSDVPIEKPLINFLLTGLMGITAIGQWIVLFLPINIITLLGILIVFGIISGLRKKKISRIFMNCRILNQNNSVLFYIVFLVFLVLIMVFNAGPVTMDDTASYHIQMVKWIQEFGSVPGIANLHMRFGFNSSWFSSIGLLSYPFPGLNTYITLNGLLCVWFCYFLLEKTFAFSKAGVSGKPLNQEVGTLILLVLSLFNWSIIRGSASSANYDFISTCCIAVLFINLYNNQNKAPIEWLIWPVYLFTVRIMNFPLLILSMVYIFHFLKPVPIKRLLLILFFGGFIIVPFLIRNIILSGYLFFPVYQLDFFSFDWKADKMKLIEISNYIKYFNRVNPMYQSMTITERMYFPNWISGWYNYLFRPDKFILTLSFFGYLFLLFSMKYMKDRFFRIFLFTMICQLISWFFIGPDPRFVYGPLLFGIFAGINCLPAMKRPWKGITKYSVLLTSSLVLIYGISKIIRNDEYRNFLTPRRLPVPAVRVITVGHVQMHIPEKILNNWNPRCYDIELPCLYKQDPRLEARGERIADGFRLKHQGSNIFTGGEYKISE
ncbi:MAG TPA: hypothetical protein VNW49_05065 [Puia sp.]|nr:hypothetical protein [Puia sp.]